MGSLLNQTVFITQQVEVVVAFLGELVELSLISQSLLIFLKNAVRKGHSNEKINTGRLCSMFLNAL